VCSAFNILQAISPSGVVGTKCSGLLPQESYGLGGREIGDIRMLVDKGRGVVDFVVDYEVEILDAELGKRQ